MMFRSSRSSIAPAAILAACALTISLAGCFSTKPVKNSPKHIGTVVAVSGSPSIVRKNQSYIIDVRSLIYEGDIVNTDSSSKTRIEMIDDSVIRLGEGSHFVFHQYDYEPGASSAVARMTFTSGSMRIDTRMITEAKRPKFEIRTPLAIIGVRGTEFWGGFIFGDNTLDVAMLSGKGIYVTNDHSTVEIGVAGFGTTVIGGTAPQPPYEWSSRKLDRAVEATAI